jgi:adenosylcobinamide amidohydrolase
MQKKEVKIKLNDLKVEILYHKYQNFEVNTLLISFSQKHRIISTFEGYREVRFVANHYQPSKLSEKTMKNYDTFREDFPNVLGISKDDIAFLSTGANMNNLATCEKSYDKRIVCCFATGGTGNALRSGVDKANWLEQDGMYTKLGTINIILLTNVTLSDGALARSIVTATEAKTAALQDMDARSSVSPKFQATGTGTDNVIVISGLNPNIKVRQTGGHTKLGELIGATTKIAVAETIKKHEEWISSNKKMHIF